MNVSQATICIGRREGSVTAGVLDMHPDSDPARGACNWCLSITDEPVV
jgi:hypothetical protein